MLRSIIIDMKQFLCVILFWLACINCSAQVEKINTSRLNLYDSIRNRSVPVNIYYKTDADSCYKPSITQIVIISNGYGIKNTDYSFIAHRLVEFGYFVVSIQHDLPTDEPLARTGNIYELRKPIWERGVDNINFVISWLKAKSVPAKQDMQLVWHKICKFSTRTKLNNIPCTVQSPLLLLKQAKCHTLKSNVKFKIYM